MGKFNQNSNAPGGKNKGIDKKRNQKPCQRPRTNNHKPEGATTMQKKLEYGNTPLFHTKTIRRKHEAHVTAWIENLRTQTAPTYEPENYRLMRLTLAEPNHNTKTKHHRTAAHKQWAALPDCLRPACIEPPEFFGTDSEIDPRETPSNPDIPDNMSFFAQGSERYNSPLDDRRLDDRCFREFCVQTHGNAPANLFLEPKHGQSKHIIRNATGELVTVTRGRFTKSPTFLDASWLAKKLRCEYHTAHELKTAFKLLNVTDWNSASRIINGITGSGTITSTFKSLPTPLKGVRLKSAPGLTSYAPPVGPPNLRGLQKSVDLLVHLAQEVEAVTIELPPMVNLDLNEDTPDLYADSFWAGVELTPEQVPFIIDELDDLSGDSNPYTAHALRGDGSDSLPLKHWAALKTASDFALSRAAKIMRPYMVEVRPAVWTLRDDICITDEKTAAALAEIISGARKPYKKDPLKFYLIKKSEAVYRKKNCGLTDEQTSHFWGLWRDRRAEITNAVEISPEVKRYAANLASIKNRNRACAYLYALRDGREFRAGADIIHPAGLQVIPTALKTLWSQLNEQHPKTEKTTEAA